MMDRLRADVPNKFDVIHLAQWRAEYHETRRRYIMGKSGDSADVVLRLRRLGFHSNALDVELKDLIRLRAAWRES